MMSEEERKILPKDSAKFTYDANPYPELSEQEWVLVQRAEQSIARWGTDFPFGELLDYAKHHNLPQEVIDTLEDFHNNAAWMVLRGADIAIHGFSEAITARAEGDDRFCLWCNQRDARERRALSNEGKELGWAP
jgi:hypothetical protein